MGEQAIANHAGDLVDAGFEFDRIVDGKPVKIQDMVAVVGNRAVTQARFSPQSAQRVGYQFASHRNYFYR